MNYNNKQATTQRTIIVEFGNEKITADCHTEAFRLARAKWGSGEPVFKDHGRYRWHIPGTVQCVKS